MSDAFRALADAATQRQREFKSKHEYTLEEFGLSKEWIQAELGDMLDHYALPRGNTISPPTIMNSNPNDPRPAPASTSAPC